MARLSLLLVAIALIALVFTGADTLAKKPVKPPPDPEGDPAIAYLTRDGLSVMDLDGANSTAVISDDTSRHPSFSPDGLRIAYMSGVGGGSIRSVCVDGSNPLQVVAMNDSFALGGVSWSSANWIAYADGEPATSATRDIWAVRPDGSGRVNLTNTPGRDEWGPSWNGIGNRLAVHVFRSSSNPSDRVIVYDVATIDGVPTIVDEINVTDIEGSPIAGVAFAPCFARTSDRLVVHAILPEEQKCSTWIVDLDDLSDPRRLSAENLEHDETHACWSADDSRIVFSSYAWRKAHIISVKSSDGSDRQILGGKKVVGGQPACRP